jgi:O-antigen biosynthesis protein
MKGKIGQSMSFGLPVVTTRIGAEGMDLVNERNALIADKPEEFGNAVVRIHKEKNLWEKISINSLKHIDENYSEKQISLRIQEVFSD